MSAADWESGQAVLRASLDAVIITDGAGIVREFNPAAEVMFGLSHHSAVGRSIGDLIVPPHHRAAHEAGMRRYMAGAPSRVMGRRLELEGMRADGSIFPVELAITETSAGGERFLVASLRDLSERHAIEAERRAARDFLQALVDDQTEIVIRSDADFRIIFCNAATSRFFGVPREDLMGQRFTPGTPPEVVARLEADRPHLTPANPMRRSIDRKILPSGEERWLEWSNRALFDDAGQLTGHLSVARDITEQKLASESLARSSRENALYRQMFEAMPDAVFAKDLAGRYLAANAALARLLGAPDVGAVLGKTDADLAAADFAATSAQAERALLDSGNHSRIETELHPCPSGGEGWITTQRTLLRDEAGAVVGLVGHARDVTEQVTAARALATSEARFASFAENAPVAMFLKDEAGRYVMLNGEAAKVIGKPHDEILGKTAREVGSPGSADQTEAADRQLRANGRPLQTVGPLTAKGEPYHWAMVLRFPIASPDGNGLWIGGFAIDVTAQHEAEQDLERSRDALHQSEKLSAMGSLLAGVAHELNNPLAIVVAQATMMEEDAADGPLAKRSEKIRRAAERCGRIVQTFLGLARRKPAERQALVLNDLARAAVDLMAYPLRTAGIEVEFALAGDLPATQGDVDMLNQVVLNLLVNAQQALESRPAPRRIRIRTGSGQGLVWLDVADSGAGVPPDIRSRIFEPFFSTKPQGVGTGVGLSFCHSVMTAHQGRLELLPDAEPGDALTGAAFRISLPVADQPAAPAPQAGAGAAPAPVVAAARVLVVDDEPELAETLAELLQTGGYVVDIATSAAQAQALIRATGYDVVLSDLRMPQMDGPAFFDWLQAEAPALAGRIAFVTGDALSSTAAEFLARAGRPVLEKPFNRAGVLRVAEAARKTPE